MYCIGDRYGGGAPDNRFNSVDYYGGGGGTDRYGGDRW